MADNAKQHPKIEHPILEVIRSRWSPGGGPLGALQL
jgi:hypothetical protein